MRVMSVGTFSEDVLVLSEEGTQGRRGKWISVRG